MAAKKSKAKTRSKTRAKTIRRAKAKASVKNGARQTTLSRANFNKRRKGILAVVMPWIHRFGVTATVCVAILWIGAWIYLSGALERAGQWTGNKFEIITADMGYAVENVIVEGREYTDAAVILAILDLQKGDPLFALDPQDSKEKIERLSWVQNVQIERRWPDTIYVGLKEREPIALWQTEKRLKLLDSHGEIITTNGLQRFVDLVMISGADAPKYAPDLIGALKAEPEIYTRTETASYIGDRRWNLRLKNGALVKLPEHDMQLALRRLGRSHEAENILDKALLSIDMRESDRISVRANPEAQAEDSEHQNADFKINALFPDVSGNNI